MTIRIFVVATVALAALTLSVTPPAGAADTAELEREITELKRRLDILTEEMRKVKEQQVLPDEVEDKAELASEHGLGPAASKVYGKDKGVSIGGYGELNYKNEFDGGNDDEFDFLRFVLYFGYKFNDTIVFNSEIELEHASTSTNDSSGSASVEFAYLDFLLNERANVRAGLVLVPVGFVNEMHEPPFFHGNERPSVETQLIPSTWRENGVGLFGELFPGLTYRTYVVTSLRASRFSSGNVRSGRQKGNRASANDLSWVGRLDYAAAPGLDLGGSAYLGNQGQGDELDIMQGGAAVTGEVDAFMQMYEAHAQWRRQGFELRALGVWIDLEDALELSQNAAAAGNGPIGERMYGWYAEAAYDFMPLIAPDKEQYLAPWVRYSRYDTQHEVPSGFLADAAQDREDVEIGLTYKPIPQVVIKGDYRILDARSGKRADELRLGAGFVF